MKCFANKNKGRRIVEDNGIYRMRILNLLLFFKLNFRGWGHKLEYKMQKLIVRKCSLLGVMFFRS
jgi:hypothetical protein